MEFLTDPISQLLLSALGPGLLGVATVATLVLASGLGARLLETAESHLGGSGPEPRVAPGRISNDGHHFEHAGTMDCT